MQETMFKPGDEDPVNIRHKKIQKEIYYSLIDRHFNSRTLAHLIVKKLKRRIVSRDKLLITPCTEINGLLVFDNKKLDGGGLRYTYDYLRIMAHYGLVNSKNIFEFCCGPAYIGYTLLGARYCQRLTLSDINPIAIQAVNKTSQYNGLSEEVTIIESDCLDSIPESERWDVVVGNPPHYDYPIEDRSYGNMLVSDPGWEIHKNFYSNVGRFMNPGGYVILLEDGKQSAPDTFSSMISSGGGKLIGAKKGRNFLGEHNKMYFLASRW